MKMGPRKVRIELLRRPRSVGILSSKVQGRDILALPCPQWHTVRQEGKKTPFRYHYLTVIRSGQRI